MLLHLTRGGGKGALETLGPLSKNRFLPLVFLEDHELYEAYQYLSNLYPIFEDESNVDQSYKRNRIRSQILPNLVSEGMNAYRTYWNFHEWEEFTDLDLADGNSPSVDYLKLSDTNWNKLSRAKRKIWIDSHLKMMDLPPLYRNQWDEILSQENNTKIRWESSKLIIYKVKGKDLYLLRKDSRLFQTPKLLQNQGTYFIEWNRETREIPSLSNEYTISTCQAGDRIQYRWGKKELSEIMRELQIPEPIRRCIPILRTEDTLLIVFLSMFDKSLKDIHSEFS